MNMKLVVVGLVGMLIGAILSGIVMSSRSSVPLPKEMNHMKDEGNSHTSQSMTMKNMVGTLDEKSGDEFDKAFIKEMIEHHEGAIDMAKKASKQAKHDEIKSMAENIISSQYAEILQMQQWQKEWNY